MVSIYKYIAEKNAAKNALGASLQEQKNQILGGSSASTNTSSILGETGYKKDKQNLSGIILG